MPLYHFFLSEDALLIFFFNELVESLVLNDPVDVTRLAKLCFEEDQPDTLVAALLAAFITPDCWLDSFMTAILLH